MCVGGMCLTTLGVDGMCLITLSNRQKHTDIGIGLSERALFVILTHLKALRIYLVFGSTSDSANHQNFDG